MLIFFDNWNLLTLATHLFFFINVIIHNNDSLYSKEIISYYSNIQELVGDNRKKKNNKAIKKMGESEMGKEIN